LFKRLLHWGSGPAGNSATNAASECWRLSFADLLSGSQREIKDKIARRCHVAYLGDHTALCRVLGRYMVFVDTRDVGFASHLMMRGIWELGLTQFMMRTIKPGMRAADIGANFGYYSLLMSDLVTRKGHCYCFEPNPRAVSLLKKSLSVNGFEPQSTVLPVALGAQSGDGMLLFVPHCEPKNACIVPASNDALLQQGEVHPVRTRSFSGTIEEIGTIDYVKIDVEGAEFAILKDMMGYVRSAKPQLVAEINFGRGYDPCDLLRELAGLYGNLRYVHTDGQTYDVTIERLASERLGLDWLVYFG
jgi:FkbM family methyltransferase